LRSGSAVELRLARGSGLANRRFYPIQIGLGIAIADGLQPPLAFLGRRLAAEVQVAEDHQRHQPRGYYDRLDDAHLRSSPILIVKRLAIRGQAPERKLIHSASSVSDRRLS